MSSLIIDRVTSGLNFWKKKFYFFGLKKTDLYVFLSANKTDNFINLF